MPGKPLFLHKLEKPMVSVASYQAQYLVKVDTFSYLKFVDDYYVIKKWSLLTGIAIYDSTAVIFKIFSDVKIFK